MRDSESNTVLEERVRGGLAKLASAAPSLPERLDLVEERALALRGRHDSRRRFMIAGAAASVSAAAGVWVVRREDGDRVRVGETADRPGQRGEWAEVPLAPLSFRRAPAVVWADTELIVWGGTASAEYLLPPDGATWRPGSDEWESMAEAPAGAIGGGFAVWDGAEMFVGLTEGDASAPWNDESTEAEPLYGIAAYAPGTDIWRYVAPIAADADERLGSRRQAVLTSDGLVVAVRSALPGSSGHERDVVAVNTATGEVASLPPGPFAESPYSDASGEVSLATVGELVVAVPNWDLRPWVLDLRLRSWRRADGPPGVTSAHLMPPIAAGSMAFVTESDGVQVPWQFDPSTSGSDAWSAVDPPPGRLAHWSYEAVWSGAEMFVPGYAFNPSRNQWRSVEPPPRGRDRQRTLQAQWADGALLLFGGEEYDCPDDAACDREPGYDTLNGFILANP